MNMKEIHTKANGVKVIGRNINNFVLPVGFLKDLISQMTGL